LAAVAIDRQILMGPDWVARAAAGAVNDPKARWMLRQPRDVRQSYAREVHGRPDEDRRAERWMLLQPDHVRHSYVEHVLDKQDARMGGGAASGTAERRTRRRRTA
jgi:hypothetical protein